MCINKEYPDIFGLNDTFVFAYILDIDGGYTEWSKWTECTSTCGGGTKRRSRTCTKPTPKNNGKTCVKQNLGPPIQTESCNTKKCGKNIAVVIKILVFRPFQFQEKEKTNSCCFARCAIIPRYIKVSVSCNSLSVAVLQIRYLDQSARIRTVDYIT